MSALFAIAALTVIAGALAMRSGLPRRNHRPRALGLVIAPPPPPPPPPKPPKFTEHVMYGRATVRGECTRCYGPWEACALGCVGRPQLPPTRTHGSCTRCPR